MSGNIKYNKLYPTPRLQVIQYTKLAEVQVNLRLILVLIEVTFFSLWCLLDWLDCLQGWKPSPCPLRPRQELPRAGSLSLTSISPPQGLNLW